MVTAKLYVFIAIINRLFSIISCNWLLLTYRKVIDFQIFILYLTIYPKSFSADTFTFSTYIFVSSLNNGDLIFSFLIDKLLVSAYVFYCIEEKIVE